MEQADGAAEAERVVERLERIEDLRSWAAGDEEVGAAAGAALLGELRALLGEAEAWARVEGDLRARAAVTKLRERAAGMS